jgi:6-phosphogluconolactonase (cycloisomerase 2 family)
MRSKALTAIFITIVMTVFSDGVFANGPDDQDHDGDKMSAGAVYTMTNASDGNHIVIFARNHDGVLTKTGSVSTGGTGSGSILDPLGSQNSIVLSNDHQWLLAVNAGSNEISAFQVRPDGLKLTDRVNSGGLFPISLTVFHDLVYVLNAGTSPNIAGFKLSHKGRLTPLAGSSRLLASTGGYAQVGFDPKGEILVVTDKTGSRIFVYSVNDDGFPAASPVTSLSNGTTPFGFIFDARGRLLVVETGPNAVSSYKIRSDNTLQVISGSVPDGQKASCWIVGDEDGDVFTMNPGSGTVSSYLSTARNGKVSLVDGTAGNANKPLDAAIAGKGHFLYILDPGNGGVDMFRIENDGGLTNMGTADGDLSLFAQGLASR